MFFFFILPFLACVGCGAVFFFKDYRNIPLGILFIVGGLIPMVNIMLSFVCVIILLVKASSKKSA